MRERCVRKYNIEEQEQKHPKSPIQLSTFFSLRPLLRHLHLFCSSLSSTALYFPSLSVSRSRSVICSLFLRFKQVKSCCSSASTPRYPTPHQPHSHPIPPLPPTHSTIDHRNITSTSWFLIFMTHPDTLTLWSHTERENLCSCCVCECICGYFPSSSSLSLSFSFPFIVVDFLLMLICCFAVSTLRSDQQR